MRKTRKLYNNLIINELENKIELKIITKVPQKWLLIDLEHLQYYSGTNNNIIGKQWLKIHKNHFEKILKELINEDEK
jgi:hypothetical protein